MEKNVLEIFIAAAVEMLSEMFGLTAKAGKPVEMDHLANHDWEVSGIIGITGKGKGMLVLRFKESMILELLDKVGMTPGSPEEIPDMVNGLVGEIVNVVSGHSINTLPGDLDITVPLIVQGLNHKVSWPKFAPVYTVPYSTEVGGIEMAVCYAPD